MNTPRKAPPDAASTTPRPSGGEASGQFEGLRHPVTDDQRVEQRLADLGLDDQGDVLEDELRDRNSSGVPADAQRDEGAGGDMQRH